MEASVAPQVIVLAHGSRQPQYARTLERLLDRLRQTDPSLHLAYMELGEPGLDSVITPLATAGHQRFVILPLFFGFGRHLLEDIPAQIDALKTRLDIQVTLGDPLADQPEFCQAILQLAARLKAS